MNNKLSITNDMLVAYLDGEAGDDVGAYIEAHPDEFAAQLAELSSAENDLRTRLRAFQPISSFDLGQYHLGLGNPAERERIARYLELHPHAVKSLDMLDSFLAELDPGPVVQEKTNLLTQARIIVARLLGDGTPQGALAMGLRGAQEGVYDAGEYQVIVESDTDFDDPSKLALSGLLTGMDDTGGLTAQLWRSNEPRQIAAVALDAFGNFGFTRLAAGKYELIISNDPETSDDGALEIHIQNITV